MSSAAAARVDAKSRTPPPRDAAARRARRGARGRAAQSDALLQEGGRPRKAAADGWYRFVVDIWITNLNLTEFGIYKRSRNRAKSRQFTSDMDIFAEVIENGERTGLIGYREDLWEKAEGMDKRLVFKLFNETLNWRATMDLMIGRSLQQTIAARGLPVMTYSINTDEDNFIVYLERSANKWPLLPENFAFFIVQRRRAGVLPAEARPDQSRRRLHALRPARPGGRPPRRQGVLHRRQVEGPRARATTPTGGC